FMCEACLSGKVRRKRYKERKCYSKNDLEVLHGDLNGPHAISIDGCRYFSVLVDEKTRFLFVGLHKDKSEVAAFVESTLKSVSRQFGLVVKRLHTDNGSEFVTNSLKSFADSEGIQLS